jgi:hypothetical protein
MGVVGPRRYKYLKSLGKELDSVVFSEQQKQAAHVL